jgi:hypothetical protein
VVALREPASGLVEHQQVVVFVDDGRLLHILGRR